MTEEELKLELQCYKTAFNKECDIENLKLSEIAEFITLYLEVNKNEIRSK